MFDDISVELDATEQMESDPSEHFGDGSLEAKSFGISTFLGLDINESMVYVSFLREILVPWGPKC
jgi:hypothetical protein